MEKYEYKFIEVPAQSGSKTKAGATFEECKISLFLDLKMVGVLNRW